MNSQTVELIVSIDVTSNGPILDTTVRQAVCKALDKVKLRSKGYKMAFVSVYPYSRPTPSKPDYDADARRNAADTADNFIDNIVEMLVDDGKAGDDLINDYPGGDQYHYENNANGDYNLSEAGDLMRELREHIETDKGLWESLEPEQAIISQAVYTYGNAVYAKFKRLIEEINDGYDFLTIDLDEAETEAEQRRDRREELEDMEKRTRDEYTELQRLRKSATADTEDAVANAKAASIRKMVEAKIEKFKP
jgi:hypothetical protein